VQVPLDAPIGNAVQVTISIGRLGHRNDRCAVEELAIEEDGELTDLPFENFMEDSP
jgi:hypothetical protein